MSVRMCWINRDADGANHGGSAIYTRSDSVGMNADETVVEAIGLAHPYFR